MAYGKARGARGYGQGSHQKLGIEAEVAAASPHRLTQMLFHAACGHLARAQGCMQRGETVPKGEHISKAMAIIEHLQSTLDLSQGDVPENLNALYDYMSRRLLQANLRNDEGLLREVSGLLTSIREAWDSIADSEAAKGQGVAAKEAILAGTV